MIAATVCGALDHEHVVEVLQRALALLGLARRCGTRERYGYGPQNLTTPGMPGSLGQRRGSPVSVIGAVGGAVVAAVVVEHLVAAGVQAGHAHRVLGGLGAAVGEEHHVRDRRRRATSVMSRAASLRASLAWNGAMVHSRPACSWMAATSFGCWWPMFTFISWLEKSR